MVRGDGSTMREGDWTSGALARVHDLEKRAGAMERERGRSSVRSVAGEKSDKRDARQAEDDYALKMLMQALAAGFTDTRFVRCPDDYYDWDLAQRRHFLNAASTKHLTKSIVFENTRDGGRRSGSGLHESRYVCCVVGYGCGVDTDVLRRLARDSGAKHGVTASISKFNFRLAADCEAITGYERNGVTPLGMRTSMPVVLDDAVARLDPPAFWLGGGQVTLKWSVLLDEFLAAFDPLVARISTPA